jgi:hypothetical protein
MFFLVFFRFFAQQALPLLSYIPSGLPSKTEAGLSLTPLTLAVVVIIVIFMHK